MVHRTAPASPPADDLETLMALERRLAARVEQARAESAAAVEAARAEAQRIAERGAASLASELLALREHSATARRRRLRAVERLSRRRRDRWCQVEETSVRRAAAALVDELLAELRSGAPP
jgi:hypothetical protein